MSSFLSELAVARRVTASTQNQALNALVFLYREVLHLEPGRSGEVERVLSEMSGTCQWMAKLAGVAAGQGVPGTKGNDGKNGNGWE